MNSNFVFKIKKGKKPQPQLHVKKTVYNNNTVDKPVPVPVPVQPLTDFEKLFKNIPVTFAHNIKNA